MKVLKHIFSWTIWSLVALYALVMAATHLPFVQSFLANRVSSVLAEELGTSVSIGRIDLGFFNRIIIDDVLILDQREQEMLRIGRLSARLELAPLAQGRINISSAQLFGAHAQLYRQDSQSPANFQFVLDSLASTDTTTQAPINLRIGSFIMRHSSLSYDQYDYEPLRDRLDPKHLKVIDMSAHINLKSLKEDTLNIDVKRLELREQSGLAVDRLSFLFTAGRQNARLNELTLKLPHSTLLIDSVTATYNAARLKETLNYRGVIGQSGINLADLGCLLPPLRQHADIVSLSTAFHGTATQIAVPQLLAQSTGGNLRLQARGWAMLTNNYPSWHAEVAQLMLSADAIKSLQSNIEGVPELVERLGTLNLSGTFDGQDNGDFTAQSELSTDIGNLSLQATVTASQAFSGHVATKGLNLRKLMDDEDFGMLATMVDVSGNPQAINIEGQISQLQYQGHDCQIELDGRYQPKRPDNKWLNARGAMKIRDQWGDATYSATVDADITASNLNDAQGSIDIDDFTLTDSLGTYKLENIHLKSGYENEKHYLRLSGDMGEAILRGHFDWATLPQSLAAYIASKLPTLPGLPTVSKATTNDFDLSLRLTSTEWMKRIFHLPLIIEQPLQLQASINDLTRQASVSGQLPAFTYEDAQYRDARIELTSPADTMKCDVSLTKLSKDGKTDFRINASASDNQLFFNFGWDNHTPAEGRALSGQLHTIAQLYPNEQGKSEAHLRILPSQAVIDQTIWSIEPGDILYSDQRLLVDHLSVEHGGQHLTVSGMASTNATDTLTIDLLGIEVAYVLDIVGFDAVSFSGQASGRAYLTQLFDEPHAWASLQVGDFHFEHGRMGTLFANVVWNQQDSQIDINAIADDGPRRKTYIDGYVSPVRDYIDLDIRGRGTNIEFMHSFTSSFLSNESGQATGDLRLAGPLDNINLTGQLVVDGQATVTALGTTYQLRSDTIRFIPDDIQLDSIPIYDKLGNVAYLSGGIHHQHLTSLTFDLDVATPRLLGYDFSDFGEEVFYGTVIAAGNVDLHGRPGEVTINCNVTPLAPSSLTYNAASTDAISQQEFITWRSIIPGLSSQKGTAKPSTSLPSEGGSAGEASPATDIIINFLINTTPESEVRLLMDEHTADYITLHGQGVIRASYHNKGAFLMFGTYEVENGTYGVTIQNIIKKNFQFQQGGTIIFGGNPMDATLNLQALYTVNGVSLSDLSIGNTFNNTVRVNCLMNILGQARAPQVEFDLDIPNVNSEEKQMIRSVITSEQEMNQQVLYLLGIGRFYTAQANNANANQQYGQTELAMQSFLSGTLSTQINEVISQFIKNNDWNFGANISTGNEGWHNAEYEGLISGRMLNNRLLINGQFGYRDNATQASPSFIGDFDIRYLLRPDGNLALKVYNQTNDRYFTRSSLNTQGIGLIIKKDFNGLSDLLRPRRKK